MALLLTCAFTLCALNCVIEPAGILSRVQFSKDHNSFKCYRPWTLAHDDVPFVNQAALSLFPFITVNFTTFNIIKTLYFGYVLLTNGCIYLLSFLPFTCGRLKIMTFVLHYRPQTGLTNQQSNNNTTPLLSLAFGATSGTVAQTVCYPIDTVRRRMTFKSNKYAIHCYVVCHDLQNAANTWQRTDASNFAQVQRQPRQCKESICGGRHSWVLQRINC